MAETTSRAEEGLPLFRNTTTPDSNSSSIPLPAGMSPTYAASLLSRHHTNPDPVAAYWANPHWLETPLKPVLPYTVIFILSWVSMGISSAALARSNWYSSTALLVWQLLLSIYGIVGTAWDAWRFVMGGLDQAYVLGSSVLLYVLWTIQAFVMLDKKDSGKETALFAFGIVFMVMHLVNLIVGVYVFGRKKEGRVLL